MKIMIVGANPTERWQDLRAGYAEVWFSEWSISDSPNIVGDNAQPNMQSLEYCTAPPSDGSCQRLSQRRILE